MNHKPVFIIVDLFCGFGGTTTGFTEAEIDGNKIAKVIACINHDPKAIKSHWLNHPEVKHFEEDIRTLDLTDLISLVNDQRKEYPDAYLILWASLECTNFSKAKGGLPRDADSRTLADHLHRYIKALRTDYIQIENVVEFMSWGPLDENGKPLSRKNGSSWIAWRNKMCKHGYYDEWRELNSADYGAYTSRNRLFGCFAKHGFPIMWPPATHSKKPSVNGMYGDLKKWKPVKDVLDFNDEGKSIFNRDKALSEKTLERIYAGLIKYVAKGDTSFISKYYSGKPSGKNITTDGPAGTVTTIDSQALVQANFLLQTYAANSKGHNTFPVDNPARIITTRDATALVQPVCLLKYDSTDKTGKHYPPSLENPSPVIITQSRLGLIQGEFLPKSIEEPAPTITASRKHHYIVNPSWTGNTGSIDDPCCVIIARQDKSPLYFVQVEHGGVSIAVYPEDSPMTIKIKEFMVAYCLVDIKMRMLRVNELLKIQGFPVDYKMVGNQSDHKKFIGNSVHPKVPKAWAEALAKKILSKVKAA